MSCGNHCYEIGGGWVGADPNCSVHGLEAQRVERRREEEAQEVNAVLEAQAARITQLEGQVRQLLDAVADIRGYRMRDE